MMETLIDQNSFPLCRSQKHGQRNRVFGHIRLRTKTIFHFPTFCLRENACSSLVKREMFWNNFRDVCVFIFILHIYIYEVNNFVQKYRSR